MSIPSSCTIHPTAIISSECTLGEHCTVGPYAIIEGDVTLGDQCTIGSHVRLVGTLKCGHRNKFYHGAVVGECPQHLSYKGQPTSTEIGDDNTFREYSTVHRGSHMEGVTKIGNANYLMVSCHIGHDSTVGNRNVFANSALVAGHVRIADQVFMSGNTAVHQFARLGRLTLLSGCAALTNDAPPFTIVGTRNTVHGVNLIGMRRSGIPSSEILKVKRAFRILYREDNILAAALDRLATEFADSPCVQEIVSFCKTSKRGVTRSAIKHTSEEEFPR